MEIKNFLKITKIIERRLKKLDKFLARSFRSLGKQTGLGNQKLEGKKRNKSTIR